MLEILMLLISIHAQAVSQPVHPPPNFVLTCFKYGDRTICQYKPQ